jgi:hypothetical protein
VAEYAAVLVEGGVFPPIVVFFDGEFHWLADGFHRLEAHKKVGNTEIDADVRQGTQRDAILHSVGANATHGLRRSTEDKQNAIRTILLDAEWRQFSDRDIAKRCGVDHKTVGRMRSVVGISSTERKFTTKHGTVGIRKIEDRSMGNFPVDIEKPSTTKGLDAVILEMVAEIETLAVNLCSLTAGFPAGYLKDAKAAARNAIKAWGKIDRSIETAIESAELIGA